MLGVNLSKGMTKDDLNATQLLNLANALMKRELPVTFNVNLDVENPNAIAAAMSKMDYIVSLNGKQVISTTMSNSINVPAKSKNTITIPVTTDLFQLLQSPEDVPDSDLTILIGPEGDFSIDEVNMAIDNGFHSISLGECRLRTETACLFAVSIAQLARRKLKLL